MAGRTETVIITGARAPVALHLARLYGAAGWRVVLADTPERPLSAASRHVSAYRALPPPRFAPEAYHDALERLLSDEQPRLVIPTCEEIFYLASVRDRLGGAMPLFAPSTSLLHEVHDKHAFIMLCARLGLAVPETHRLESAADRDALRHRAGDLVFKPVWSRFASHVRLRPRPQDLADLQPSPSVPWVAQRFLNGRETSVYAVADKGRLLTLSAYRSLYRAGKGAGICFEPVVDTAIRAFVTRFVGGTGWTGQISFDLMVMPDGSVLPLECNPRATSGLHFYRDPARFVTGVDAAEPFEPDQSGLQTVRLALWAYGLPAAMKARDLRTFRAALSASAEILDWPGDPAPKRAQWAALAEIARLAFRERISLQQASTRDIEWNGPFQSSI